MSVAATAAASASPSPSGYLPSALALPPDARADLAYVAVDALGNVGSALPANEWTYNLVGDWYEVPLWLQAQVTASASSNTRFYVLDFINEISQRFGRFTSNASLVSNQIAVLMWSVDFTAAYSFVPAGSVGYFAAPLQRMVLRPGWSLDLNLPQQPSTDSITVGHYARIKIPTGPALTVEPLAPTPLIA